MSNTDLVNSMKELSGIFKDTRCILMIFDDTYQVTDCDTEVSYDFSSPNDAIAYVTNKRNYINVQAELTDKIMS